VQRVRGYPRQPHASYPRECVRARARTRELQRFDPTCQSNPLTDTIIRSIPILALGRWPPARCVTRGADRPHDWFTLRLPPTFCRLTASVCAFC
jgi:hypothetical protein